MDDLHAHFREVLGYDFRDRELLLTALTHRSLSRANNERLEYLGDALLGLIIAEALFVKFPQAHESELSKLRSSLVNQQTLARLARELELGAHIRFGAGEHKSGGGRKDSLLANALEAVAAAIYLDSDLERCRAIILELYSSLLAGLTMDNIPKDPKTRLQEYQQARKKSLPVYRLVAEDGEDHDKLFTIECSVEGIAEPVIARDNSKRKAEQLAAKAVLELIAHETGAH